MNHAMNYERFYQKYGALLQPQYQYGLFKKEWHNVSSVDDVYDKRVRLIPKMPDTLQNLLDRHLDRMSEHRLIYLGHYSQVSKAMGDDIKLLFRAQGAVYMPFMGPIHFTDNVAACGRADSNEHIFVDAFDHRIDDILAAMGIRPFEAKKLRERNEVLEKGFNDMAQMVSIEAQRADEAEKELNELREALPDLDEFRTCRRANQALKSQLARKHAYIARLKDNIDTEAARAGQFATEKNLLEKNNREMAERISRLELDLREVRQTNEVLHQEIKSHNKQLEDTQVELIEAYAEIFNLAKKNQKIESMQADAIKRYTESIDLDNRDRMNKACDTMIIIKRAPAQTQRK